MNKVRDLRSALELLQKEEKQLILHQGLDIQVQWQKEQYNVLEIRDDVIQMVVGEEIDITINEEFRAGQGTPKTKEEIYKVKSIIVRSRQYNDFYIGDRYRLKSLYLSLF